MVLVSSLLLPLGLTLGASLATTAILVARSTPASASTLPSVASITQMGLASYALTTSGNVYSWGSNAQGQLGNGSNADIGFAPPSLQDSQTTPTEVLGVGGTGHLSGIASLTAVSGTVYALSTLGNVYAWGLAQDGQIGNGTAPFGQSTPVEVEGVGGVGYLSDVVQVAALNWTAYAVTSSGNVYAWGDGADGQLGNGTTTSSQTTPVEVSGVGGSGFLGDVTTLYVGPNIGSSTQREAFALTSSGNIFDWGTETVGELGNGTLSGVQTTPVEVEGVGGSGYLSNVIQISGLSDTFGEQDTYALTSSGDVFAWGYEAYGGVGNGSFLAYEQETPIEVVGVGGSGYLSGISQLAVSASAAYAIDTTGHVYAWGPEYHGSLGNGTTSASQFTPVEVEAPGGSGFLSGVTQIEQTLSNVTFNEPTTYALTSSGSVYAWGPESAGELGNDMATAIQTVPSQVLGAGAVGNLSDITQIAGGGSLFVLALDSGGHLYGWGSSAYGELGDGSLGGTPNTSNFQRYLGPVQTLPFPVGALSFLGVDPIGLAPGGDLRGGGSDTEAGCACSAARPVDLANGDYYDTTTDLSIAGAGVPLTFTRTYDAVAAQQEAATGAGAPSLGYGWSDNLGVSLTYQSGVATVTEGNGAEVAFDNYPQGAPEPAWCPSDAVAAVFCPVAPRIIASLSQSGSTWTFTNDLKSPVTYTLSGTTSGVLTSIADKQGDMLQSSSYSPGIGQPSCPTSNTCTAWSSIPAHSSAATNELVEAFDSSSSFLDEVFDPNSATQSVSFTYVGAGCSTWGSGLPTDLCQAKAPGNLTTSYTYDSSNSTSSLQYDQLTMTPPTGGTVTNVYNSGGQVTQQTTSTGTTNQVTAFAYAANPALASGSTTTVTSYPDGIGGPSHVSTYQFSNNVYVGRTDAAGATTYVYPDPTSLRPDLVANGNGNTSNSVLASFAGTGGTPTTSADALGTIDALGNMSQQAYTADNQVWCSVDKAETADQVVCPATQPSAPPAPGATDPNVGADVSIFNANDQIIASTDALGNTTVNAYTAGVSGVPDGLLYCTVDPVDYQAGVTCPAYGAAHVTGTATKTYDTSGDVLTSTDADGNTTTYAYSDSNHPGMVTLTTDPDGTETVVTYDAAGHVTTSTVTSASGGYSAETVSAYDPTTGRKYCEIAPAEVAKAVTCPSSPPTSPPTGTPGYSDTIYDAAGRVTSTTSPIGGTTQYAYDGEGNKYCTVTPADYAGGTRCPTGLPLSVPTPSSDPYLGATIDTFDADGRVVQATNPLGGITLSTYDGDGNVVQSTVESNDATHDPNVVTTKSYNADDEAISTSVDHGSSLEQTTLNSYDPNGDLYCTVSPNAVANGSNAYQCPAWAPAFINIAYPPSALYSTTPSTYQANNVTVTFSNDDGQQIQSTNPDVATTATAFDGDGRQYCTVDATNFAAGVSCPAAGASHVTGTSTTSYSAAGQTLAVTDQMGDTTTYTHDPDGKVLTTTNSDGTTTNCYYWEMSTCAAAAPTGGGSPSMLYSTTTPATSVDPSGATTTYAYDPGGQTSATTTPAGTTTNTYDAAGNLTSVVYSGTASGFATPTNLSYTYNADDARHTMTDATGTTSYGYDANGDVTSKDLSASTGLSNTSTSYGYYSTGVLSTVTYPSYGGHSSPQVTYAYDATGAMTSETDWLGNQVTFSHDADGNSTSQSNDVSSTNPGGTSSTNFSFDAADRTTAAASTINQTCGPAETLTQSFGASGGSRNPNGQLTQAQTSYSASCSGQTSAEVDYAYDAAGRVTYQGSTPQGANPATFAYDGSGDPTTISNHSTSGGSFNTYTQSFDGAGEVTGQSPAPGSGGSATSYSYDTLGDQTQATTGSDTSTYGYNQAAQLASASTPAGPASYLYNGDGLNAASSTAAGAVWGPPSDVNASRALNALSCTSQSFCVAVGNGGYASVNNGTKWSSPSDVDGTRNLDAVSCTSSSFCAAVDSNGHGVIYNGTSWSTPADIDASRTIKTVSCVSASLCGAVDARGYAIIYNGSSWSTPADVDAARSIDALSCISTSFCMAVDTAGYAITYNDMSWSTPADIDGALNLDALSCTSASFCVAVDTSGHAMTYNGSTWMSPSSVDAGRSLNAVSCPSADQCVAVDGSGYALTYNMTSWSTPIHIDGANALQAISCASTSSCTATDNAGNAVTYNGSTWSSALNVDGTRSIVAVSCPSTSFCATADASGYAVLYAAVSTVWTSASNVDSSRAIKGVSCPNASFCAAVDGSGYATTYNGKTWSTPVDIDGSRAIAALTCTSASFCAAVDTSGYVTTYDGSSWSAPTDVDAARSLDALSCTSATFCAAVDTSGYAVIYNGSSWSSPSDVDGSRTLNAVSCTSSTFCVAVGGSGYGVLYTGSWAAPVDIDAARAIQSVDCASATLCVAAGAGGYATTFGGSSWSTPVQMDGTRTVQKVKCPSATMCAAVDSQGYVNNYNGSVWSSALQVDIGQALDGISCPSASFCEAVDNAGNVVNYDGSGWSVVENVDGARTMDAISCTSATFCAAADSSGYALTYQPQIPTTLTQTTWNTNSSLLPLALSDGINDYIYGPSASPVEQVSLATSTPTYLTFSAANDTWLSTNAAGDETGFWGYDAFGNLAYGTPTSPFGYSGQYADATTSLVNDRARWYDSQTGEFTSVDPALASTNQPYAYAGDDPVNNSDPTGLQCGSSTLGSANDSSSTDWWSVCAFDLLTTPELGPSSGGFTAYAAAGIVGNLQWESGNYRYWNTTTCYEGTCGFGIAQWTVGSARYDDLVNKYGRNPSFVSQVDFVGDELNGLAPNDDQSSVITHIEANTNYSESWPELIYVATVIVEADYETPSGAHRGRYSFDPGSFAATSLPTRYSNAIEAFDKATGSNYQPSPLATLTSLTGFGDLGTSVCGLVV